MLEVTVLTPSTLYMLALLAYIMSHIKIQHNDRLQFLNATCKCVIILQTLDNLNRLRVK